MPEKQAYTVTLTESVEPVGNADALGASGNNDISFSIAIESQIDKLSFFTKVQEFLSTKVLLAVLGLMIGFGQFNDTKELATSLYEEFVTFFYHDLQYKQLDELAIGRSIAYAEAVFGPPEVVKPSPTVDSLIYQYYNIDKAVICIMNYRERVAGFVVIPIIDNFVPTVRYRNFNLGNTSFSIANETVSGVFFDANNLTYYAEAIDLGKQYMFLQEVTGYVEYGNLQTFYNEEPVGKISALNLIGEINTLFIDEDSNLLDTKINAFRDTHSANFYAYTELDAGLIPESLLTRFEFNAYFGGKNE